MNSNCYKYGKKPLASAVTNKEADIRRARREINYVRFPRVSSSLNSTKFLVARGDTNSKVYPEEHGGFEAHDKFKAT